jgi:hypothetical protein
MGEAVRLVTGAPAQGTFRYTEDQLAALELVKGPARHTMLFGGARSGKTLFLVAMIVLRAATARHVIFRHRFNHVVSSIGLDTLPKVMALKYPQLAACHLDAVKEMAMTDPGFHATAFTMTGRACEGIPVKDRMQLLDRLMECDWGRISEIEDATNQRALKKGGDLLGKYDVVGSTWVVRAKVALGADGGPDLNKAYLMHLTEHQDGIEDGPCQLAVVSPSPNPEMHKAMREAAKKFGLSEDAMKTPGKDDIDGDFDAYKRGLERK